MTIRRLDTGGALLALALAFAAVAAIRWRGAALDAGASPAGVAAAGAMPRAFDEDSLDESAGDVVERDPFRLSRTPPTVPFAGRGAQAAALAAPAFRPALALKGIVGGPPWQAVLDGIPGQPAGTVVKAGSAFDRMVIQAVSRDTVVVQLPDTVLRLTLVKGTR